MGQSAVRAPAKVVPSQYVPAARAETAPAEVASQDVVTDPSAVSAVSRDEQVIVVASWAQSVQSPEEPVTVTPGGTVSSSRTSDTGRPVVSWTSITTADDGPLMDRSITAGEKVTVVDAGGGGPVGVGVGLATAVGLRVGGGGLDAAGALVGVAVVAGAVVGTKVRVAESRVGI